MPNVSPTKLGQINEEDEFSGSRSSMPFDEFASPNESENGDIEKTSIKKFKSYPGQITEPSPDRFESPDLKKAKF